MRIYIASSWKNQHTVEMLTALLEDRGYVVLSFVRENFQELEKAKEIGLDEWVKSENGRKAFEYDISAAMTADFVIYISPSGKDAAAEVGAAYAKCIPIFGLYAKGEDFGLMRRLISVWVTDYRRLLQCFPKL